MKLYRHWRRSSALGDAVRDAVRRILIACVVVAAMLFVIWIVRML
jgi:uncharacterized membrane protein